VAKTTKEWCPNATWFRGKCRPHSTVRFRHFPCCRRDCGPCGELGRWHIAERIAYGVRHFGVEKCAWLVLTFDTEVAEESWWKREGNRRKNAFVKWLRDKKGMPDLEYACTFELTKRGRLHLNLIVANWVYVDQRVLEARWGARVWVERVKNEGVAVEVAKAQNPEGLAGYLSKLEQAVPQEWGRRVSFSKGWPHVPVEGPSRVGKIDWLPATAAEVARLEYEQRLGVAREVTSVEWSLEPADRCGCFQVADSRGPPVEKREAAARVFVRKS